MNDDLKHYRAPRLFDWIEQEPALILIVVLLAAFVLDAVPW